mgnify:CR=1 FL=1|jgi:prophage regulatory protein
MLSTLPVELVDARPVIRRDQLRELVPLANTTVYEMEQRGEFPKRFYLTPRCPVWDLKEVNCWLRKKREETEQMTPPHPDVRRRRSRPVRV